MKPSRLVTSGGVRRNTVRGMRKITKAALAGGVASAAIAASLAGCAAAHSDSHANCAMKWADAFPGHPLCPDSPDHRAPATTQPPHELDQQFSLEDAAFLSDLRGVWNFTFDAGSAVSEAHAMCGMPKGQTASALPDIIRLIDPDFTGGNEKLSVVMGCDKVHEGGGRALLPRQVTR